MTPLRTRPPAVPPARPHPVRARACVCACTHIHTHIYARSSPVGPSRNISIHSAPWVARPPIHPLPITHYPLPITHYPTIHPDLTIPRMEGRTRGRSEGRKEGRKRSTYDPGATRHPYVHTRRPSRFKLSYLPANPPPPPPPPPLPTDRPIVQLLPAPPNLPACALRLRTAADSGDWWRIVARSCLATDRRTRQTTARGCGHLAFDSQHAARV